MRKPPKFDSFTLRCLLPELRAALVGGQVQRIRQPDDRTAALRVYHQGASRWLVLSCDARSFRAGLAVEQPSTTPEAPPFCMLLRKCLEGGRIQGVAQVGADRILQVCITAALGTFTLVAELMGRSSNILLLDDEDIVQGSMRRFRGGDGLREVAIGCPYPRLPYDSRPALWDADALRILSGPNPLTDKALTESFSGVSPFLAGYVRDCAGLGAALNRLRAAAEGDTAPTLYLDDGLQPAGVWPIPSPSWPAGQQTPIASLGEAIEAVARSRMEVETTSLLRREALALLDRERERIERRVSDLDRDEQRAGHAEEWRIAGELLAANTHSIERGAEMATLLNWYDADAGSLSIVLDPTLGPRENVEAYFARARKARAAGERVPAARAELHASLERLERERESITSADAEGLRSWLESRRGSPATGRGRQTHEREYPPGVRIRRFDTDEGYVILVGDNATGNDWLTTKVSDPNDIWLHVRAAASAHGVIRTGKRPDAVPPSVLRKAAEIVASKSEVKASGVIPVDYTERRYVRKPRGAAPGRVTYSREKTLFVGKDA